MKGISIRIPRIVTRTWNTFEDWSNVILWESATRRWHVLRLDVLIAFGFVFCVGYYWFFNGWVGALQGAAMYIFLSMCALWFFRPTDRDDA